MPRRRKAVAPLNPEQVLKDRITDLEKRLVILESPRMSSFQTLSHTTNLNDPAQGMTAVNATSGKPEYYHDSAWRPFSDVNIDVFRARRNGDPEITVSHNNTADLVWGEYEYSSSGIFSPTFISSRVYSVRLGEPGVYGIDVTVEWVDDTFTGTRGLIFSDGWSIDETFFEGTPGATSINASFDASYMRTYPPINEVSGTWDAEIKVAISQNSGSPQNVSSWNCYFTIIRFGALPVFL